MYKKKDLLGEILGGYRIGVELGAHSSHRTFLGEDLSPSMPDQSVVIKLQSTESPWSLQEQQRFLKEISTLQRLSHPSILPILSAGIYKDMPYIITRYITLGSLHNRLLSRPAEKPLPQEEVLSIIAQIGQALHHAHQQHVVHGNIKPQNVLFSTSDEVLLTDFYPHFFLLSNTTTQANPPEIAIYRAPEQLSDQTSEAADQYALGCLCYEMFTGHKPFLIPSVHIPDIHYKTKSLVAPRQFNPALPLYIEVAILKAMSREPDQRHRDILAFLNALGISSAPEERDQGKAGMVLVGGVTTNPNLPTESDLPVVSGSASDPSGTAKMASPFGAITPEKPYFFTGVYDKSQTSWGGVNLIQKDWKRLTVTHGRILIPIMSLVAIALVVATLFITLHFSTSTKKLGVVTSYTHTTSITHIPTPTRVSLPSPTPTAEPSPTPDGNVSPPPPDATSVSTDPIPTPTPVSTASTGLTGYWDCDEGSGSRANDSSGNGYTGTLQGGASWTTGKVGSYALNVSGNGYVDIPEPVINTAASFSVAAWVKLNSNSVSQYQTFVSLDGNQVSAFYLQLNAATGTFAFNRLTGDSPKAIATIAAAKNHPGANIWYHLVGVYDANAQTISFYVNGSLQQTVSYTSAWRGSGHTVIGRGKFSGNFEDFVNGQIDDVRIYNTALSPESVAALANS